MLKNKFFLFFAVAVVALVLGTDMACAADVFDTVETKGAEIFEAVKSVIFIVGGFGLVILAVGGIFGKVNWKAFSALAIGLMILAAAGAIVEYATDAGTPKGFDDTLGE